MARHTFLALCTVAAVGGCGGVSRPTPETAPAPAAATCSATSPADMAAATPEDRERIAVWFRSVDTEPVLPAQLYVDCAPATAEEFLAFLYHDPGTGPTSRRDRTIFTLRPHTPMTYVGAPCAAMPPS